MQRQNTDKNDAERVTSLFELYLRLTALLGEEEAGNKGKRGTSLRTTAPTIDQDITNSFETGNPMQPAIKDLSNLREALLALPNSGPGGFEGLLATAFEDLLGVPFRLAKSGSQFGMDGKAADPNVPLCFEAKLYSDTVPSSEVLNKLLALAIRDDPTELWVLGATSGVSTQTADDLNASGRKLGIATLILDWQGDTPALAAVLVAAHPSVSAFLQRQVRPATLGQDAVEALGRLARNADLSATAEKAIHQLRSASVAAPFAREANRQWLRATLANRRLAKSRLGQALSPLDTTGLPVLNRQSLVDGLQMAIQSPPSDQLVAVLGDEGHGKSWLAMKCWADRPDPPLTLVITPDAFGDATKDTDWDQFLVGKLLTQTEDSDTEQSPKRWLRRFGRWRHTSAPTSARLWVIVDGINQRPGVNWGDVLDSLVLHVKKLGGCTVVTSRTQFFESHVAPRLITSITRHPVPQWSETERDEILKAKGWAAAGLHPAVAHSLRNPRLLGVALGLLNEDTLLSLDGLSVPQLLFEHLRTLDKEGGAHLPMAAFAKTLQSHAQEILQRVRARAQDDLTVFEQLEPAAEGQFFRVLEDDPSRYTFHEQGLSLALGFAVIDELRKAQRNGRDLYETLMTALEPVAALDQTAEAVLAALTIACIDATVHEAIGAAVLVGFADTQNPDGSKLSAFIEMARRRVRVFCLGAETLLMEADPTPNEDWVKEALLSVRKLPEGWNAIRPEVEKWLSYWWPDEWLAHRTRRNRELPAEERERLETEDAQRKQDLSPVEQAYVSRLTSRQSSPFRLMTLGLQLCAGQALAELAPILVDARFSMALASSSRAPSDEFMHLIRFNRIDWMKTRDLLVERALKLGDDGTSAIGRWTAVALLLATGDPCDAQKAYDIREVLVKDRKFDKGWKRIEGYCAVDPCDPGSLRPDNIAATTENCQQLDVGLLAQHMGQTVEDSFFVKALPGLARFSPDIAVRKHREFLASIPNRRDLPLRQAAWKAEKHSVLFDKALAAQFLSLSASLSSNSAGIDEDSVEFVQQSLLLAVFPHLAPREQFAGLMAVRDPNHIWLEVTDLAKPGDLQELSRTLKEIGPSDPRALIPLVLASVCDQPMPSLADMLPALLASPYAAIRSTTLLLVSRSQDRAILKAVVDSDWSAAAVDQETHEYISGSFALIEAAKLGVIPGMDILDRIAPKTYGTAFCILDEAAREQLAARLDACLREASAFDSPLPPVVITLQIARKTKVEYEWHSLEELPGTPRTLQDSLAELARTKGDFDARQQRLHDAYEAFRRTLTLSTAAVVLAAFKLDGLQALVEAMPQLAERWATLLKAPTAAPQFALRNFGLLLATALTRQPGKLNEALELYDALVDKASYVQIRYTAAHLPLEAVALWWATDEAKVNIRRFTRLDRCQNDHELAQEAAAALYAGKGKILDAYIQDRLQSSLPVDIARAITVAGFSGNEQLASDVLRAHESDMGLLGEAVKTCRYAMDRHRWAKHWFQTMQTARNAEDFWAASVLFLKVVDARFDALHRDTPIGSDVFNQWWWSVERQIKNRFDKWAEKRKKTLFGSGPPAPIFVSTVP